MDKEVVFKLNIKFSFVNYYPKPKYRHTFNNTTHMHAHNVNII